MEKSLSRPAARRRSRARGAVFGCAGLVLNLLSLVLLLATLVFAVGVAAVYRYPSLAGLLPPTGAWLIPTQPRLVAVLPSLTPVPTRTPLGTPADAFPTLPPEWTPTDTPT